MRSVCPSGDGGTRCHPQGWSCCSNLPFWLLDWSHQKENCFVRYIKKLYELLFLRHGHSPVVGDGREAGVACPHYFLTVLPESKLLFPLWLGAIAKCLGTGKAQRNPLPCGKNIFGYWRWNIMELNVRAREKNKVPLNIFFHINANLCVIHSINWQISIWHQNFLNTIYITILYYYNYICYLVFNSKVDEC